MVENSNCNRTNLKRRLIREGLLLNKCYICNLAPNWNGKELSLQLDHINGISNDNRLENLRILCPNCHAQTDTFAGKKLRKTNTKISKKSAIKNRKTKRPNKEELQDLIWQIPAIKIALKFGVSDKAVEKWCKFYKINKPGRGYWQKLLKHGETGYHK